MSIIIKDIDGQNYLYNIVADDPSIIEKLTDPVHIQYSKFYVRCGVIKNLCGLKLETEYNLDIISDFEVVDRGPKILHSNGLEYSDLYFELIEKVSL